MFNPYSIFFPWNIVLVAIAVIHFVRRRPDNYWLWIIILGGGLGALIYIAAEVVPDFVALRPRFNLFARKQRIAHLRAVVKDNPAAGNWEELGGVYLDDKQYQLAKDAYDRSISVRTDSPDPFYRRALCELELGDFAGALHDLQFVVKRDPRYDFLRAPGLLAWAYAMTGDAAQAEAGFQANLQTSTLSETMLHYAEFLQAQGRMAEARDWAQKVADKKDTLPGYLKRRERPWLRHAAALLKQLPRARQ